MNPFCSLFGAPRGPPGLFLCCAYGDFANRIEPLFLFVGHQLLGLIFLLGRVNILTSYLAAADEKRIGISFFMSIFKKDSGFRKIAATKND